VVEVSEVAAGHGTGDLALTDGSELKGAPLAGHLIDSLRLSRSLHRNAGSVRKAGELGSRDTIVGGRLLEVHGNRRRHVGKLLVTAEVRVMIKLGKGDLDESMILPLVLSRYQVLPCYLRTMCTMVALVLSQGRS
jgi:hypothetical protein